MNKTETILLLKNLGIKPNKNLGQNFLINDNICKRILKLAKITNTDVILEIGPGLGALLSEIVNSAKKVYAFEIDTQLFNFLKTKFNTYDNLELYNMDILEADIPDVVKVVSNVPYTITGPIFEKIFYVNRPPEGILIIEKKIADRIFTPRNYKNFSKISVIFNAFMEPVKRYDIPSSVFYPEPKINLSLIHAKPRKEIDPFLLNKETKLFFFKLIRGIMPYKNKNLANALVLCFKNNLKMPITKQKIIKILDENNIENNKFALTNPEYFLELSKVIWENIQNENEE